MKREPVKLQPRLAGSQQRAKEPEPVDAPLMESAPQPTRAPEPATRSEIVYVVLPPEQVSERIEKPGEPRVVQPIINVTVEQPRQPERPWDEVQPLSPNGHTWDKAKRETEPLPAVPATVSPLAPTEKEYQYVPKEERKTEEPEGITETEPKVQDKKKFNEPDKGKVNEPLNFSPPKQAPEASPRKKFQHTKREPGRQRKYHQTIALLEAYYGKDTEKFDKLDEQMQRYYKREYAEYFGRESKSKSDKRLANRTKAVRTKRESERRKIAEISRNLQRVPDHGSEVVDIQDERRKRAGT